MISTPTDTGLSVVDCTGISIGNADIEDSMARREPNLPTLDAVMRGISRRMREDGLLPDRRCGVGMWAWRAAQWLALGALGLAYLLAIVAGVAVLDDVLNGPAQAGVVTTYVRG